MYRSCKAERTVQFRLGALDIILIMSYTFPIRVKEMCWERNLPLCGVSSAVERYPSKLDVVGSIPIPRFLIKS
jgi:hypothetical protein